MLKISCEGLKYKPETYTLEDETGTKQYKAFLISCANASQYATMPILPLKHP